jgi:hypothetical protein
VGEQVADEAARVTPSLKVVLDATTMRPGTWKMTSPPLPDMEKIAEAFKPFATTITVSTRQLGKAFTTFFRGVQQAAGQFSVLAERQRPSRPVAPVKLAPDAPCCSYCHPRVEWARMMRIDRNRRRMHRRAVRRYKRLPPVVRQRTYFPRVFVDAVSARGAELDLKAAAWE